MRSVMFGVLLLAAACSPAQRTALGGGVAAAGVGVTYFALESMVGSCPSERTADGACPSSPNKRTPASVGLPVAAGGLGIAFLGGIIMATANSAGGQQPAAAPDLPEPLEPTALAPSDAVAMATARLLITGIDGKGWPPKLLGVDSAQSRLEVEGNHAELWNLRVHTAADDQWLTVGACYDFDSEWQVTSLGTSPCVH